MSDFIPIPKPDLGLCYYGRRHKKAFSIDGDFEELNNIIPYGILRVPVLYRRLHKFSPSSKEEILRGVKTVKICSFYKKNKNYWINLNKLLILFPDVEYILFDTTNIIYNKTSDTDTKKIKLSFDTYNDCNEELKNKFNCINIHWSNSYECKKCKKEVFPLHKNYKKNRDDMCSKCNKKKFSFF